MYKNKLDKIIWSFSTLHMYETCPYSFYLYKIEDERGQGNASAEIGSYGHELNERIFSGKISAYDALLECIQEFDNHVTEDISEASKEKKFTGLCNYLSDFDESYKEQFEVLAVEKKVVWEIGKYRCIGFIDLILRKKSDKTVFLIDHKSAGHFLRKDGKPLKNMEESYLAYKHQMYMYADAMQKLMGITPDYIVWNHFLEGTTTVIKYNQCDQAEALRWAKDIIERIYEDEEFNAKQSYVMCNMLCNYRELCEYKEFSDDEE